MYLLLIYVYLCLFPTSKMLNLEFKWRNSTQYTIFTKQWNNGSYANNIYSHIVGGKSFSLRYFVKLTFS